MQGAEEWLKPGTILPLLREGAFGMLLSLIVIIPASLWAFVMAKKQGMFFTSVEAKQLVTIATLESAKTELQRDLKIERRRCDEELAKRDVTIEFMKKQIEEQARLLAAAREEIAALKAQF